MIYLSISGCQCSFTRLGYVYVSSISPNTNDFSQCLVEYEIHLQNIGIRQKQLITSSSIPEKRKRHFLCTGTFCITLSSLEFSGSCHPKHCITYIGRKSPHSTCFCFDTKCMKCASYKLILHITRNC